MPYELELQFELNTIHLMFHVSMLRNFMGYLDSIAPLENVSVEENLIYEEVPVEILDRQVMRFRKDVVSIKALFRN